MKKHWASYYLGKQYIKGKHDCCTLFYDVQNNVFNTNIEELVFGNIDSLNARKQFVKKPLRQRFKEVTIPVKKVEAKNIC